MRTLTAASVAALLAAGLVPATASAHRNGLRHNYQHGYWQAVRELGRQAPGRNIVNHGVRTRNGVREATRAEIARSIRTFRRWLAPPVAPAAPGDRAVTASGTPSSPAQQGGRWSIPSSIVMCESGGDYNAVNSSSGARGAYQMMESTYYAYGGDGSWSPADQDRVAARVWNGGAGRSQWAC
jgi:hypothetical protein